ncbi:hypothetical protein PABG_11564 [Paracoccidioides brasiliensis Pb03]|nr:hypothetical protein PABG_11564 [Paracoccidioides brasiliensis Pb03]
MKSELVGLHPGRRIGQENGWRSRFVQEKASWEMVRMLFISMFRIVVCFGMGQMEIDDPNCGGIVSGYKYPGTASKSLPECFRFSSANVQAWGDHSPHERVSPKAARTAHQPTLHSDCQLSKSMTCTFAPGIRDMFPSILHSFISILQLCTAPSSLRFWKKSTIDHISSRYLDRQKSKKLIENRRETPAEIDIHPPGQEALRLIRTTNS